jgi:hypothetical protein
VVPIAQDALGMAILIDLQSHRGRSCAALDVYCTISVTCVELLIGFVPLLVAVSLTV